MLGKRRSGEGAGGGGGGGALKGHALQRSNMTGNTF